MNLESLSFSRKPVKILFFGVGNPARQDDAAGIRFVETLEQDHQTFLKENFVATPEGSPQERPIIHFETNYQLNIEDALLISDYDLVIFADASKKKESSFSIKELLPTQEIAFSTHAMSPSSVLGLCEEVYKKKPKCFLLAIPGFSWELSMRMTNESEKILSSALQLFSRWVRQQYA